MDLPAEFGCWNSIYQQFNRWSSKAKLMSIFKALVHDPDLNGSSLMAVSFEHINIVPEQWEMKIRLLENPWVGIQPMEN